jgi:hypothetical protein|tara:strand:+ start:971 stop:1144 length:174 start_codon:yes stop_codon:yes gene_type:complete
MYDEDNTNFPIPTKVFDGSSSDKNYSTKQQTYKKKSVFVASIIGIVTGFIYISHILS